MKKLIITISSSACSNDACFPQRNDVAILTFNYDPYLAYLLEKAVRIRCQVTGQASTPGGYALSSGFHKRTLGAIEDADDLCVLHLHGMIAWPAKFTNEKVIWFEDLFDTSLKERIEKLCFSECAGTMPPVVYPWEIINEKGHFRSKEEFCLIEEMDNQGHRQGGYMGPVSLYDLFVAIWKRARKEINRAGKISFVGLSMHDFLNPAFQFLFAERRENAAIVCATKEHEHFRSAGHVEAHTNPRSPTFKLRRMLKELCPAITGVPNRGSSQIWIDQGATVRVLETFREFIFNEMD